MTPSGCCLLWQIKQGLGETLSLLTAEVVVSFSTPSLTLTGFPGSCNGIVFIEIFLLVGSLCFLAVLFNFSILLWLVMGNWKMIATIFSWNI